MKCGERLHEIVREEVEGSEEPSWKETMERSFSRMDKEVTEWCSEGGAGVSRSNCRCELRTPQCDAVGSTAVVAVVTPDKIVVSNCGDSRAVLCRTASRFLSRPITRCGLVSLDLLCACFYRAWRFLVLIGLSSLLWRVKSCAYFFSVF